MANTVDLFATAWQRSRLSEALDRLAAYSGIDRLAAYSGVEAHRRCSAPLRHPADAAPASFDAWARAASARLGLTIEAIELTYRELDALVVTAAPALWRLHSEQQDERYVAVVRADARSVTIIDAQGALRRLPSRTLRDAIAEPFEQRWVGKVHQVLDAAAVPARRRSRARTFLLREHLAGVELQLCWTLRAPVGESSNERYAPAQLTRAGLVLFAAHALHYALVLGALWTLGHALLDGRFARGPWFAFALLLLSAIPARIGASWAEALTSLRLGSAIKQRLLAHAFRVPPDSLRSEGAGELLARVIEVETIETLGVSGAFVCLLAIIELSAASWLMLQGIAPALLLCSLACWLGALGMHASRYLSDRTRWASERMRNTRQLVEHMLGHRTRLAQQVPERLHDTEDAMLSGYIATSQHNDRLAVRLNTLASRGLLPLGLTLLCARLSVTNIETDALLVAIAALLLAQRAGARLAIGVFAVCDAWIALGQQALPIAASEPAGQPDIVAGAPEQMSAADRDDDTALLDVRDVSFRHAHSVRPVLRNCSVRIGRREQLLLQGESGGGKSTLLAVLSGQRRPSSGVVLMNGLDRASLGAASWRKHLVVAPQFHDNHLFNASFAFNVLMGTRWPASAELGAQAEAVCRELGLGGLIDRMPAGMAQQLGENGWQLSHGEKSRLFIARALIQDAPLLVLDESFAALDPDNTLRALQCVRARARALLVVAHP